MLERGRELLERRGRMTVLYIEFVRYSKLDAVPSLALGTSPVTLRELVAAYAPIANGGTYHEPLLVLRIEKRGADEAVLVQRAIDEHRPREFDEGVERHRRRIHSRLARHYFG